MKILIVTSAGQGIINPSLMFANRLLKMGVHVTFSTSFSAVQSINKETSPDGLIFAPFSDGIQHSKQSTTTPQQFLSDFATMGASAVAEIINSAAVAGTPFNHLVYTTAVSWAATVANTHGVKSTLLWCQAATILDIYYYYYNYNGYENLISSNKNTPTFSINLPGLPRLSIADLPSFLSTSNPKEHDFILQLFKDHIDVLKIAPTPRILVNTFGELETGSIRAIENLEFLPVGPLIPFEIFDELEDDCILWLNTKPKSSAVYVSFGSLTTLCMDQAEEVSSGLLESGQPFIWVIRDSDQKERLSKIEDLQKQGMIVAWCSQVKVLSHQAIGCFVTHCGWNSTLETLAAGVPVVAFPQWTDQATNAKMIEDEWKIGVRISRRERDGVMEGKEMVRCVETVMGNEEMKRNAEKWSELAKEAVSNGGSSTITLQAFLDDA